jgi:DNA modification methylase
MELKIINEDCLSGLKKIKEPCVDLTWTSPPYYNAKAYSEWPTYEDYLEFLKNVFLEIFRITKDGRMCVVNLSPVIVARESRAHESKRLAIPFHFFAIMEEMGWKYIDDIVWVKPEGAAINRNGGFFQHRKPVAYKPNLVSETIFVFQKPANFLIDKIVRSYDKETLEKSLVNEEYERSNVWLINPETKSKHLAPYPEKLSDNIVK